MIKKIEFGVLERFIMNKIYEEYGKAIKSNQPFNNPHEGWAVIKEEVDELWDEVKKKKGNRSKEAMMKEAVQIGAMALRFIIDLCLEE